MKACLEHGAPEDAIQAAKAQFHAHLASAAQKSAAQQSSQDLVEDAELLSEDREIDADNQVRRFVTVSNVDEIEESHNIYFYMKLKKITVLKYHFWKKKVKALDLVFSFVRNSTFDVNYYWNQKFLVRF